MLALLGSSLSEHIEKYCCSLPKEIREDCTKNALMANPLLQENAMGFEGNKVESQGKENSGCKDLSSNDHKYFDGKSLKSKKPFE